MCAEAGVRLLKLAPYSPDMNPIEELFAEIKTYIRQQRRNAPTSLRKTSGCSWKCLLMLWVLGRRVLMVTFVTLAFPSSTLLNDAVIVKVEKVRRSLC